MTTTNHEALMRIRAIKPGPLYLLIIMRVMGLMPPPNLVAADVQQIAAAAGWTDTATKSHLAQLLSMLYVGRLHYRAWYITDAGISLVNPESTKNVLSALVSSSSESINQLSLLTTTTNSESTKNVLSENSQQPALLAPALDPNVARLAALLHNEHGTAMRYALQACQNALTDGSPLLTELCILYWSEYLIENSNGVRNRAALVSHSVGRGEFPANWWIEKYRPQLADAELYEDDYAKLTVRQKRIVDLEFERKALAVVVEENVTTPTAQLTTHTHPSDTHA